MNKQVPVNYMQRSREYYAAQGFEKPYHWAEYSEIPWHEPEKSIADSKVTFVTTAVPNGSIPKLSREASSHKMDSMPDEFRTDELSWDKEATHTRDPGSYIPFKALEKLTAEGHVGSIARNFHFVPTDYSKRNTIESDAPKILEVCQQDEVDIAILVPL